MKILFISSRFPYPLEKGDKIRTFYFIRELSLNHKVTLIALTDIPLEENWTKQLTAYCEKIIVFRILKYKIFISLFLNIFSKKPFQIAYFYSKSIHRKIEKIIQEQKPDVIFCQLIRVAEYVKNRNEFKILDYMDTFSKGMERRYKNSPFYLKPFIHIEHKRLIGYEKNIFDYFQKQLIISQIDQKLIQHKNNDEIEVISNGVDTRYFFPQKHNNQIYDIIFAGNMAYPPNIDSAIFLVKEILPILIINYPNIKILLAGATPHRSVKSLGSKNVTVTGWVDDIRNCYSSAKMLVAPLQMGTGIQTKVLEAMAMRIPCIVTSLVNNPFNAINMNQLVIANSAEEFSSKIVLLLQNDKLREEIAENGYQYVLKNFTWDSIGGKINRFINDSLTLRKDI
jgi:polysaccharide biosynthesis protein PslH